MPLNDRIYKLRTAVKMTREQFAELVNVSVSYMAEVERGRTGVSVKTLTAICRVLGLSADYLLFGAPRSADERILEKWRRLDAKYHPLVEHLLNDLLALEAGKS